MSFHDHIKKKRPHDKKPVVNGQFAPRPIEMYESPAFAVLSRASHLILARLEIEIAKHGGYENGSIICTHADFKKFGIEAHSIAPAIRELEKLGFIKVRRGSAANREHRAPNAYLLTYRHHGDRNCVPASDDWRKIETIDQARAIARAARAEKPPPRRTKFKAAVAS